MRYAKVLISLSLAGGLALSGLATAENGGRITPSLHSVDVVHNGKTVTISRATNKSATVPKAYARTSRPCPPFCVQPMQVVPGVDTIAELEVLGYLKRMGNGDRSVMVVDSRTPDWVGRGTIPGSVNIPWNKINMDVGGTFEVEAEAETLNDILTGQLGAQLREGKWDFRNAKTLVLFCNGIWCPQSSVNIKTLAKLGYPTYKLKWYRGGMQSWTSVGLTTVSP
ncbi:MAG: rhodanese-like domain-containing protein [Candidatus Sedimenticola sp. (ex Thyasira tokunagai)]